MNINSFSAAGIATNVWGNATRTLTADPATDAGASTLVWTHAARTLTATPIAYTDFGITNTLAAATVLDIRPATNKHRMVTVGETTAGGTQSLGMYDGTTFTGSPDLTYQWPITIAGGHNIGPALKNDAAGNATYFIVGFDQG